MTDFEIREAFGGWSETSPTWRALRECLDRYVDTEVAATAQPTLSDEQRHFNAGRLARALDTREDLLTIMQQLKSVDK